MTAVVFPENSTKPCKVTNFSLENFKRSYLIEKNKSLTVGSIAYLSARLALKDAISGNLTYAAAEAVSSIAFTYVWNHWTNQNYELTIAASKAMRMSDEKKALVFIEQAANIHQCFNTYPSILPFVSLGVIVKAPGSYQDLFDQAIKNNYQEIIQCLGSLGYDVNRSNSYLGYAKSLETVRLLCDMGADVNLANEWQTSSLSLQFFHLKNAKLESCLERCKIIEFLLSKNANFYKFPNHLEEKAARESMHEVMNRKAIQPKEIELLNEVKEKIRQLAKKLSIFLIE